MNYSDFIPPFSDYGFKNLFGKEKSKENLIFLLNELLKDYPDMYPIVDITYKNVEKQGDNPERKSTRFDVYCHTESGRVFIVEMQNQKDQHLKQRLIFYLCQAVTEQDSRIEGSEPWNYDFPPVMVIMFCDFLDREIDSEEVNYFGFLNLKSHKEFGNHVGLCVIQLPLFPKEKNDCHTELEKIIYSMKNMDVILEDKKQSFSQKNGDFYDRIARMSQTAALTKDELHEYHQWLKVTNDDRLWRKQAMEEGREEGRAQGLEEGRAEGRAEGRVEGLAEGLAEGEIKQAWKTARKMKAKGLSLEDISEFTGLSLEQLNKDL